MITENANIVIPSPNNSQQTPDVLIANTLLTTLGVVTLVVTLFAGAKLIYDYMVIVKDPPSSAATLFAQIISLAFLFLMGWGISIISIRVFDNPIYPLILRVAGFCISLSMVGVYSLGIVKCYAERELGLEKYVVVMLAGYLALAAFYLLTEKADLRFMALPLVVTLGIHIFLLVIHYIFVGAKEPKFIFTDLGLMLVLLLIIRLMLTRKPYIPFQQVIKIILPARKNKAQPGLR